MLSGARYAAVVVITPEGAPFIDEPARILGVNGARRDLAKGWYRFTRAEGAWDAAPVEPGLTAREYDLKPDSDLSALLAFAEKHRENCVAAVVQTPVDHTDSWAPSSRDALHFGTTTLVKRLINVVPLYRLGATGQNVNVVIVDRGLHRGQFPAANYGGAWIRLPDGWGGSSVPPPVSPEVGRHGTMIARTILSIAPDAKIWELRAVAAPNELISGLGDIDAACTIALADIRRMIKNGAATKAWIFVNPWGLFDRRLEAHVHQDFRFATSPGNAVNRLMESIVTSAFEGYDVIFAAGNGGQFAPSRRQGPLDRGPGCSILGANGHPSLLSVGAVRSDGIWLGYSSQGNSLLGELIPSVCKPDVCAPSNFVEAYDHARLCTGTSAASAVAAGVVALLRSWELNTGTGLSPPKLLADAVRRGSNRQAVSGAAWRNRTGAGLIDAEAARQQL